MGWALINGLKGFAAASASAAAPAALWQHGEAPPWIATHHPSFPASPSLLLPLLKDGGFCPGEGSRPVPSPGVTNL